MPVISAVLAAVPSGLGMPPSLHPPVAVLEADHVVQLGGRHLEDVGVLAGRDAVARARRDVPAVARPEPDRPPLPAFVAHLEVQAPREHTHGLLLHPVVLQAERLAGPHVQDLPHVAVGASPDELVPPGLGDVLDLRWTAAPCTHAISWRAIPLRLT